MFLLIYSTVNYEDTSINTSTVQHWFLRIRKLWWKFFPDWLVIIQILQDPDIIEAFSLLSSAQIMRCSSINHNIIFVLSITESVPRLWLFSKLKLLPLLCFCINYPHIVEEIKMSSVEEIYSVVKANHACILSSSWELSFCFETCPNSFKNLVNWF